MENSKLFQCSVGLRCQGQAKIVSFEDKRRKPESKDKTLPWKEFSWIGLYWKEAINLQWAGREEEGVWCLLIIYFWNLILEFNLNPNLSTLDKHKTSVEVFKLES